jgi:hypothetical protein
MLTVPPGHIKDTHQYNAGTYTLIRIMLQISLKQSKLRKHVTCRFSMENSNLLKHDVVVMYPVLGQ